MQLLFESQFLFSTDKLFSKQKHFLREKITPYSKTLSHFVKVLLLL